MTILTMLVFRGHHRPERRRIPAGPTDHPTSIGCLREVRDSKFTPSVIVLSPDGDGLLQDSSVRSHQQQFLNPPNPRVVCNHLSNYGPHIDQLQVVKNCNITIRNAGNPLDEHTADVVVLFNDGHFRNVEHICDVPVTPPDVLPNYYGVLDDDLTVPDGQHRSHHQNVLLHNDFTHRDWYLLLNLYSETLTKVTRDKIQGLL